MDRKMLKIPISFFLAPNNELQSLEYITLRVDLYINIDIERGAVTDIPKVFPNFSLLLINQ